MKYVKREELTDYDLKKIAEILIRFGEITESMEILRQDLLLKRQDRDKLGYLAKKGHQMFHLFVPNSIIYERVMRSKERLPLDYQEKLSRIKEIFNDIP